MRHPKILIAGIGVALAAAGGISAAAATSSVATPGIAPIAASPAATGTVPAVPSGGGYGGY
jgi:hypothetical protein